MRNYIVFVEKKDIVDILGVVKAGSKRQAKHMALERFKDRFFKFVYIHGYDTQITCMEG
jgi:hypothetical protein